MRHLRASWQSWHSTEALDRLLALIVMLRKWCKDSKRGQASPSPTRGMASSHSVSTAVVTVRSYPSGLLLTLMVISNALFLVRIIHAVITGTTPRAQ